VVTHDSRIYPFADRIVRLEDGQFTNEWKRNPETRKGVQSPQDMSTFLEEHYA
jgi:ABC-type lipoprotein export system ATPase subunit